MEQHIKFLSGDAELAGTIHIPEGLTGKRRLPAVILAHGFGGTKDGYHYLVTCPWLNERGFVALRFDFRGCGESGGEKGRVIWTEEVEDLRNAVNLLQAQRYVDPDRIGVIGFSLGGCVALYAASSDPRIHTLVAVGAVSDFGRLLRRVKTDEREWEGFMRRVAEGKERRVGTGNPQYLHRDEILPLPSVMITPEDRIRKKVASTSEFTVETVESLLSCKPVHVIGRIAPRAILLIHGENDVLVPPSDSEELFAAAKEPKMLKIVPGVHHFYLTEEDNIRILNPAFQWLAQNLKGS